MNHERIRRFSRMLHNLRDLPDDLLKSIVKSKDGYSTLYRVAALRQLVCNAPLTVTGGRPYAELRRRVRRHYGI